jgi:hypothetical protein
MLHEIAYGLKQEKKKNDTLLVFLVMTDVAEIFLIQSEMA